MGENRTMQWKKLVLASLLAGIIVVQTPSMVQAQSMSGKSAVSATDKTFMMKAAQGNIAEVATGTLATKKASNSQVKQFGQHMITDHSKANSELMTLATSKGVSLPKDTDAKHKAVAAKLSKLSGAAFDKAYMKEMVKDHEATVALFQKEAKQGRDTATKSWASKTLPNLQHHLQMAKTTYAAVNKR